MGPKLKPFDSNLHVLSGNSIGLACIAEEGNDPITFYWTKDGNPVTSLHGMVIGQSNMFSSLLGITEATSAHVGMYSCRASNAVGFAITTTHLEVDGNSLCYQSLYWCLSNEWVLFQGK